ILWGILDGVSFPVARGQDTQTHRTKPLPLTLIAGRYPSARIRLLDAQGRATFELAEENTTIEVPLGEIVTFGGIADPRAPRGPNPQDSLILFPDGGRLAGYLLSIRDGIVTIDSPTLGILHLPQAHLAAIV